jgi:hypothetical protein
LRDIGLDLSTKQIEVQRLAAHKLIHFDHQDTFALYDVDGGGTIELEEFSHFIQQQYSDAVTRIRDMTESLGRSISSVPHTQVPLLVMVTDVENEDEVVPYLPPKTGKLKMEVSFVNAKHSRLTGDR